jgi:hypothetical protein
VKHIFSLKTVLLLARLPCTATLYVAITFPSTPTLCSYHMHCKNPRPQRHLNTWYPLQKDTTVFFGGGRLGSPFLRASGEKCFLNPKGFRKFFECFPNHYVKDFVERGNSYHGKFTEILDFFFQSPFNNQTFNLSLVDLYLLRQSFFFFTEPIHPCQKKFF